MSRIEIQTESGTRVVGPSGSYLRRRGTVVNRPPRPPRPEILNRGLHLGADDFELLKVLGRGGFGTVYLARKTDTGEIVALKKMKKSKIAARNKTEEIRNERNVMAQNEESVWLVKMLYSFQNNQDLFIAMEYMPGGDLAAMLGNLGCLSVEHARFYAAEMVMAVHVLHKLGYIHRDLKPANFLIDKNGHLKLGDFGLSKAGFTQIYRNTMRLSMNFMALGITSFNDLQQMGIGMVSGSPIGGSRIDFRERKSTFLQKKAVDDQQEVVGSPDYIAVEVMRGEGYTFAVDWWSVGVIIYEMIAGIPPFYAENVSDVFQNILDYENTLQFPSETDEDGNEIIEMTPEAWELIQNLICEPNKRAGFEGISNHPFFQTLNWAELRKLEPPFVPELSSETDTSYFQPVEEEEETPGEEEGDDPKPLEDFLGFTFCRPMAEMKPLLASLAAAPSAQSAPNLSTPGVPSKSNRTSTLPVSFNPNGYATPPVPGRPRASAEASPTVPHRPVPSIPVPSNGSPPSTPNPNRLTMASPLGSPRSIAIKGAPSKALPTATATFMDKLAQMDNLPDHSYLNDFLDSFRKFTTPQQVLESLQCRYAYLPPHDATSSEIEEYNLWRGPVQLRVINVLKKWLERYWDDFKGNQTLLRALDEFLVEMSYTMPGAAWAPRLKEIINQKQNGIPEPPPVVSSPIPGKAKTERPKSVRDKSNFLKSLIGGN